MAKRMIARLVALALLLAPGWEMPAQAGGVKYEKTELEKARGKCIASVLGGALLGAAIGRATGRGGTATGAIIGAGAGAGLCAVLMANAKHKDQIIAAQMAAARYQATPYTTTFAADDGTTTTFRGISGPDQTIDAARLRPVKYQVGGVDKASPMLAPGGQDCRTVSAGLTGSSGSSGTIPPQLTCRTPDGDYEPYGLSKT